MRSIAACPRTPRDTSRAATPATCGVACDVPAMYAYWEPGTVEMMSSSSPGSAEPPGAITDAPSPDEKNDRIPRRSTDPTHRIEPSIEGCSQIGSESLPA